MPYTVSDTYDSSAVQEPSLAEGFKVQNRVIGALVLRELRTRFWKNRLGYFWALLEPMLHMAIWFVVMTYIKLRQGKLGLTPIEIIASGMMPMFLFRGVAYYLAASINSNFALLKYPLVKNLDVIFSRFILEAATTVSVGVITFTILISVGMAPWPRDPLGLVVPCLTLLFMGLGVGTFFAVCSMLSTTAWKLFSVIMSFMYLTSGIYFLGNHIPPQYAKWIVINPIFNCVELFRESYFYNFKNSYVSIWYPLSIAAIFFLVGLCVERIARGKLLEK